jgi:hypothetical protein
MTTTYHLSAAAGYVYACGTYCPSTTFTPVRAFWHEHNFLNSAQEWQCPDCAALAVLEQLKKATL